MQRRERVKACSGLALLPAQMIQHDRYPPLGTLGQQQQMLTQTCDADCGVVTGQLLFPAGQLFTPAGQQISQPVIQTFGQIIHPLAQMAQQQTRIMQGPSQPLQATPEQCQLSLQRLLQAVIECIQPLEQFFAAGADQLGSR